jgi:hypothetical protein
MAGDQKDSLFAKGFWQVLFDSLRVICSEEYQRFFSERRRKS